MSMLVIIRLSLPERGHYYIFSSSSNYNISRVKCTITVSLNEIPGPRHVASPTLLDDILTVLCQNVETEVEVSHFLQFAACTLS